MNFNPEELMKQATAMQEKLVLAQKEIGSLEATGESGAGLVKVTVNGQYMIVPKGIKISESLVPDTDNRQIIEQLIAAALNDAIQKVQESSKGKLTEFAGRLSEQLTQQLPKHDSEGDKSA